MRSHTLLLAIIGIILAHCIIAKEQQHPSSCYTDCLNNAAKAIGCKDASDYKCYCSKQQFMLNQGQCLVEQCPKEFEDKKSSDSNFKQLESKCKAEVGSSGLHQVDKKELDQSKAHSKNKMVRSLNGPVVGPYVAPVGAGCVTCGGVGGFGGGPVINNGGFGGYGGGFGGGFGGPGRHWWNSSSRLMGPSLSKTITTSVSITVLGAVFAFFF